MKQNQFGRSMIEMLGVLAIIAVLSVGGIAGYSKAMFMWHSNRQRDLLETLFSNVVALKSNLSSVKEHDSQTITYVFEAMGGVPEGFIYKNNKIYGLDNEVITVTYGVQSDQQEDGSILRRFKYAVRIAFNFEQGNVALIVQEYCKNIVFAAQQIPNEVLYVAFASSSNTFNNQNFKTLYSSIGLKTATLADINQKCKLVSDLSGAGYFMIDFNPN